MKTFLGTFIGILASFFVMMGAELFGHYMFSDAVKTSMDTGVIASELLLVVLIAHGLGLLIGLFIAKKIDKETPYSVYLISGFILAGSIGNLIQINHEIWFVVADILLVLFIGGLFSYKSYKTSRNN